MADQPTTDRVVIQSWSSGARRFISRARLAVPDDIPTPAGERFTELLAAVDGIDTTMSRPGMTNGGYGTQVTLAHEALWSWDEVEPAVLEVYRQLLGVAELDIVREDRS